MNSLFLSVNMFWKKKHDDVYVHNYLKLNTNKIKHMPICLYFVYFFIYIQQETWKNCIIDIVHRDVSVYSVYTLYGMMPYWWTSFNPNLMKAFVFLL